ncbi:MAG: class I SAM-dependent methyltransferase [Methanobrevibacter sp.]|uniref:class I SAM-dependent methyltransferase n=1 Tax=Methanobrevibacter sp. TaxID=66852 RepID=UPI0025CF27F5|nr:class I SAM-dependent methyltransferase [Methanobrevibacter sp.]MBQ6098438.1 class I SAM-dependent methyltransferase [Methanobrevibacter sp.]MBQ6139095.1 class I SAM-dependent methyltransferase [Methanobrevibacter sp.]MBQ6511403.1 class I SAM-dependent methyltransferase [Methanobrevibacter sp.]
MGFFDNMRKPQGKLGNIQLKSMNKEHTPVSLWGLKHLNINSDDIILDVGCGGGINIKRMAKNAKKVYGIDYSEESVKLSKEVNKKLINEGKVEIMNSNVKNLPFEDDTFDIVTAFETVYFWPDIEKCFGEVKRVLKPGGIFLIGTETNGSNNFMRFWKHFIDMEMYDDNEITSFLRNNDYDQITVYLRDGKNKKEIIKSNDSEKIVDDNYNNVSISDRFLQWMTVTARK